MTLVVLGANRPISRRKSGTPIIAQRLGRRDQRPTPLDSMPPRDDERPGEVPVGGGFTPSPDGGNDQHLIHDEDQEDATPDDYEREIDRLDGAARPR